MDIPTVIIKDKFSFPRAWETGIKNILNYGVEIKFGDKTEKKTAKDSDLTLILKGDALAEAINCVLHPDFPTGDIHLREYLKQWERGYDWKKQGFDYNYNYRACHYNTWFAADGECQDNMISFIDQWELARRDIKEQIETGVSSNRNIITISDPTADRYQIPHSPPCLLNIWIRWESGNEVSVKASYRSWDFYAASMSNIPGILSAVTREVVSPNSCYIKQFTIRSYSAHIYEGDQDSASKIREAPLSPRAIVEPCQLCVM